MEDLTDDEVLRLVYRGYQGMSIARELARRLEIANANLEIANAKLDATETQKGKSNES